MTTENPTSNERFWLCPLYSFVCGHQGLDLLEGIHIEPAASGIKGTICERYMAEWQWDDPSEFECIALLPYLDYGERDSLRRESLKKELAEQDRVNDLLYDFITACRLCHKGSITPGLLIPVRLCGLELLTEESVTFFPQLSKHGWSGTPIYEFRRPDVPKVNAILSEIRSHRKLGKTSALDESLRRFNSAYYGKLEDKLIDQMIAFESLYIADDKELGYKLALRTAFLLGKQRQRVFSDMKTAYDLRGQIVHGGKSVDRGKLELIIPKTEEYLRQSMGRFLEFLSKGISLDQIRKKLDENILTNGRTLADIG